MEQFVVLIIFLLFSLLGGALKKKPPPQQHPEDGSPWPEADQEGATFRPAPQPRRVPPAEDDPFAGWGGWPDADPEPAQSAEEAPVLVGWDPEPAPRLEPAPRPEPAQPVPPVLPAPEKVRAPDSRAWQKGMNPVPAPVVVSLETEVDRAAEHRRFHETIEVARSRGGAAAEPALLAGLRRPEKLREAVLLTEVLGPPRSVRGWDDLPRG